MRRPVKYKCSHPACKAQTDMGYCNKHRDYRRRRRFDKLRRSAAKRGVEATLSFEDYYALMDGATCFYCTRPVTLMTGSALDRIDSSLGYTLSNVVPCCSDCNSIKMANLTAMETREVIKTLRRIRKTGKRSPWLK